MAVTQAIWTGGDTHQRRLVRGRQLERRHPGRRAMTWSSPAGLTSSQQQSNNDLTDLTLTSILIQDTGYTISGNAVTLNGGVNASQTNTTGNSTLSMPITFSGTSGNVTVNNTGATLDMCGAITSTGGVTKAGSGMLDLTADSGTLGATVNAGTLLVNGNVNNVGVNSSTSTLGGKGTVSAIDHHRRHAQPGRLLDLHRAS